LFAATTVSTNSFNDLSKPQTKGLTDSINDVLIGVGNGDEFTGTATTAQATDMVVDGVVGDGDTFTLTTTENAPAVTTVNVENIVINQASTGSGRTVDAAGFRNADDLTVNRTDVTVGGVTINSAKDITVNNLDASEVPSVTAGTGTTSMVVNQTNIAGVTVNADTASGSVTVVGAATVNAAGAGDGDTVEVEALEDADPAIATAANALAVNIDTAAATVNVLQSNGGDTNDFTGAIDITADSATTVLVENATGGLTLSATADDAQITVGNIDDTGASITVGTGVENDIALNLDGTGDATDDVTVAGAGAIALDVDTTDLIEIVNLSGTTAAVTYTVDSTTTADSTFNLTGDQSVTVSQTADEFDGVTVTDALTAGTSTVVLNAAATGGVDLSSVAVDTISLAVDVGQTMTIGETANISVAADQAGLTIAGAEADAEVTISTADDTDANGTPILIEVGTLDVSTDIATANIDATVGAFDAVAVTMATTGELVLSGTEDMDLGNVIAASVVSTSTGDITLAAANAATETITTGDGADNITTTTGAVVTITTGLGNDIVAATNSAASVYDLGFGNDQITLNNDAAVVVVAGDGDDTIITGADTDAIINGGDGTDTFQLTATQDLSDDVNFALASIEAITLDTTVGLTLSSAQFAANSAFDLTGVDDAADETLTIVGTISGEAISAADVDATDAIITLNGAGGDDTLTGSDADDILFGGAGSDVIAGGTGSDTASYTGLALTVDAGTQTGIVVNLSSAAITNTSVLNTTGAFTADTVSSVASNTAAFLYGGADASNSAATDTLGSIENVIGTDGADYIVGSTGDNVITGGEGADVVTGGLGADTFVFDGIIAATNANTITDFEADDDLLQFDAATFSVSAAGTAAIETVATVGVATALDLDDIIVDLAANITGADLSAEYIAGTAAGFAIAIASDTGDIYADADGDFSDSAVIIGSITDTEVGDILAANLSFV
jgi:Ca2+-binding RTX toxin-like protein